MTLRQCAAVLVMGPSGEVLALRQSYGLGFWGVPGGVVDASETPAQAAVREAREEVGLEVSLGSVLGVYTLQGAAGRIFAPTSLWGQSRAAPSGLTPVRWPR
ncbi:NUDIX hydrolase [Deinococcus lacus]|uniref:NUDIX hydrolase n=1 Tax=Deinococcus lacus TaxID=392561 RepID=A0ABW1YEN7_9DEIO